MYHSYFNSEPIFYGGRMILGVGVDIVRVERIQKAFERFGERFLKRIYTEKEQAYCSKKKHAFESYAARFAVKEAAFKALGKGWSVCGGFKSAEIGNEKSGRPYIIFHGRAKRFAENAGVKNSHISITHDAGLAVVVVILEK